MSGWMKMCRWLTVMFAATVLGSAGVRADMIFYGNTDGPWQIGAASTQLAQTFSTGTSPMSLDSIQIWVRNASENNGSSSPGTLTVSLFATDGSRKPTGSSLLTILNSQSWTPWGDGIVGSSTTSSLSYSLSANTTYAVVFAGSAGSTLSWKYNDSVAITSSISPTPTFYNWRSTDNGGTWSDAAPTTGFNMAVNATAVPEPSTVAAVGTVGVVAAFLRLRRRKAAY